MLTKLRKIVLGFSQEADLAKALQQLVEQVKSAIGADCCSVYIADYQASHFRLMASDGFAQASIGQICVGFSEGLIGFVGQREEPINIADAQHHPYFKYLPDAGEDDFHAFLGTPIIHQRKVLGVISVRQRRVRQFSELEEAFIVTLSAQIAAVLANAEARHASLADRQQQLYHQPLKGIPGSSGVAIAPVWICQPKAELKNVALTRDDNHQKQLKLLRMAARKTRADFSKMSDELSGLISDQSLDIFEMYKHMLDSPALTEEIENEINAGWNVASALKLVFEQYISKFNNLDDSYLRERASDIRDLGNRLLSYIEQEQEQLSSVPEQYVLVADEVTASMLAEHQHRGMKAMVSLTGSQNSHAAILARALGLPAVMGVEQLNLADLSPVTTIVDGYSGELFIAPDEHLLSAYQALVAEEHFLADKVKQVVDLPAQTPDSHIVELQLNAGLAVGFEHSKNAGAQGIGLYRTEIPFMNRQSFPTEQEQTKLYREVLSAFTEQTVVMRTLDIGGDKALPYFPIEEENPFLGWRGIRITLDHPEIFLVQVRAMMRANHPYGNLAIMLPMVAGVEEVDEALRLINQAYQEVSQDSQQQLAKPKVGVMIEVPGTIFQLTSLAERVDFFSVGSNDLTQYLLAVDRNNPRVSALYDSYHPAVLHALNNISQEAKRLSVPLSLCGELAGEPAGALLLLAMGYDKLSMNPHNVARIKWIIRHVNLTDAQALLSYVLTLSSGQQVREHLHQTLENWQFGGFIRAGM